MTLVRIQAPRSGSPFPVARVAVAVKTGDDQMIELFGTVKVDDIQRELVAQDVEKAAMKDIVGQKEGSIQFRWP
jgi:hypothetical protein